MMTNRDSERSYRRKHGSEPRGGDLHELKLVVSLLMMLEMKDEATYRHSLNVGRMACAFGKSLGLTEKDCGDLRLAGMLHDIGKLFVDKSILTKEEPLTRAEYTELNRHPALGANILAAHSEYKSLADIIRWHHERYDGQGYPGRYQGDEIPLLSRIMAVCDAWVALVSPRSYRPAFSPDKAREVLLRERGRQLDPELTDRFIKSFVSFGH